MFLRESARVWCGMRRYSSRRITEGRRTGLRAECTARDGHLLGRRHALEHQHQGAPRGADVDRLVAGVQHQHRFLQSFARHLRLFPSTVGISRRSAPTFHAPVHARHRQQAQLVCAPARFSARAQAAAVEPVVITSSISRIRLPSTATVPRRGTPWPHSGGARCCSDRPGSRVGRTRRSARSTGMPVRRASDRASNSD